MIKKTAFTYQINISSHLLNPYNQNKPLFVGPDGQVIKQNVAEELCRIFEAKTESQMNLEPKARKKGPTFTYTIKH